MARHWQGQGEKTCPADGPAPRARKAQSIGEAKKARPKQNQTKCTKKIVGTHKDGPIPYVGRMHVRDIHPQFSPWHMKLNLDSSTRCLPIGLWWALQGFKWLQKTRAESCWIMLNHWTAAPAIWCAYWGSNHLMSNDSVIQIMEFRCNFCASFCASFDHLLQWLNWGSQIPDFQHTSAHWRSCHAVLSSRRTRSPMTVSTWETVGPKGTKSGHTGTPEKAGNTKKLNSWTT